jgi:hypothetical protein
VADNNAVQRTSRPTIDYGVVFAGLVISVSTSKRQNRNEPGRVARA